MSDLNGQIWYRIMSGPHIEEVLVVKETTHKITEQIDYVGRKSLRVHNKKSSYDQYVATPSEVRKVIEEMVCKEKDSVTYMKDRILKTEEKIKKLEERLRTGVFPVMKLKTSDNQKNEAKEIAL